MTDFEAFFMTWTTYGAWFPGDHRGWNKSGQGEQPPEQDLEKWCRQRMLEQPVLLNRNHREKVETVCQKHADIRRWTLHAVNARSNHVHLVVTADAQAEKVRDQFKAYCTRVFRRQPDPILNSKIWTRGGDIEFIRSEKSLEEVVVYVTEAQDRMDRED